MRQLYYVGPGKVEWRECAAPKLQSDDDAIVRPLAVTRCDLDYSIVTGAAGWEPPFALGHEIAGEVVDVGDAVREFRIGDRVIVPFQISCGVCGACRRGHTGNCEAVPFADRMLVAQPDGVPLTVTAGVADNVADGYRSVEPYLRQLPGARVLVVGGLAQGIGLYAAQAAKSLGASEVVYFDDDPARLALAQRLEVRAMERRPDAIAAPGAPFPITVDASGTPQGLALAIRSTAHGGICHRTYGDLRPATEVPLRDMYGIGLSLHLSRVHARAVMPAVLERICAHELRPEQIITRYATFDEAPEAIFDPAVKIVFENRA